MRPMSEGSGERSVSTKYICDFMDNKEVLKENVSLSNTSIIGNQESGVQIVKTGSGSIGSEASKSSSRVSETALDKNSTLLFEPDKPLAVVKELKMGKGIGRPRKKAKKFKNPFDLGLGKCKKVNIKGHIVSPKRKTSLPTISESDLIRPQDEADLIIETAQLMGFSFPLGIERGKQEIAKKLEQGDFNCIRDPSECMNCIYKRRDSELFNDFILQNNLFDLDLRDSLFTWFGPKGKKSRLYRVLINHPCANWGEWVLKSLNRKTSDHKSLLLRLGHANWGPKPFKSFIGWLQEDSLKALLKVFWDNNKVWSGNLQSLLKKAKEIKKDWSKNFTSDSEKKVKWLEDFLEVEEQKENPISSIFPLRKDLENLYILRDDILRQKSRLKWSLKGDRNTRFFHQTIRRRNHSNNIKKLWWNEEWLSSPNLIKNAFLDYFSKFLSVKDQRRIFAMGNLLTV
ncbi:hypothetical protein POM88_052697 [Heracleum sosnowskyi]|uniref:Uncharacterized protein n=1 Tax=Heracleum sosnowskyi TaxID=360622 RepID=A0AAD8GRH6_9APIA|nr:hypothetical protein POM88_052697 [Heracleum sosnowskyi]